MRRTLVLASALLCATRLFAEEDPSKACLLAVQGDPKIQVLSAKVPFDITNGQSLQVLSDPTKPNLKEKAALAHFATEVDRCVGTGAEWRTANYPTEANAALTLFRVDVLAAMADLYAGKMTFGDYAKLRAKMLADLKVKMDAVVSAKKAERAEDDRRLQEAAARKDEADRAVQAQRNAIEEQRAENERQRQFAMQQAEQQQAEARRRAALQILLQRPAPLIPPIRPTVSTNCTTFGNQTNCTTQ